MFPLILIDSLVAEDKTSLPLPYRDYSSDSKELSRKFERVDKRKKNDILDQIWISLSQLLKNSIVVRGLPREILYEIINSGTIIFSEPQSIQQIHDELPLLLEREYDFEARKRIANDTRRALTIILNGFKVSDSISRIDLGAEFETLLGYDVRLTDTLHFGTWSRRFSRLCLTEALFNDDTTSDAQFYSSNRRSLFSVLEDRCSNFSCHDGDPYFRSIEIVFLISLATSTVFTCNFFTSNPFCQVPPEIFDLFCDYKNIFGDCTLNFSELKDQTVGKRIVTFCFGLFLDSFDSDNSLNEDFLREKGDVIYAIFSMNDLIANDEAREFGLRGIVMQIPNTEFCLQIIYPWSPMCLIRKESFSRIDRGGNSSSFVAAFFLQLRVMNVDYNSFCFEKCVISAVHTLSSTMNSIPKVEEILKKNEVYGIMAFHDGRSLTEKMFSVDCTPTLEFTDFTFPLSAFLSKDLIHYGIYPYWFLSATKYTSISRANRVFFPSSTSAHIKETDAKDDKLIFNVRYSAKLSDLFNLREYEYSRIYAVQRMFGSRAISFNELRLSDWDTNKRLRESIRQKKLEVFSISGHLLRLLLLSHFEPIRLHMYLCYILFNFSVHRNRTLTFNGSEIVKGTRSLRSQSRNIYWTHQQLWHSRQEWILATHACEYLIPQLSRLCGEVRFFLENMIVDSENLYGDEVWGLLKEIENDHQVTASQS
jgi:hypothetical protein